MILMMKSYKPLQNVTTKLKEKKAVNINDNQNE